MADNFPPTLTEKIYLMRRLLQACYDDHAPEIGKRKFWWLDPIYLGLDGDYRIKVELSRELLGMQDSINEAIWCIEKQDGLENTTSGFKFNSTKVDHNLPITDSL